MPDISETERPDFRTPSLVKNDGYRGGLSDIEEDEARWMFGRLIDYFGVNESAGMPNPPSGMPGADGYVKDESVRRLIQFGFAYFIAVVRNEPRRRLNLWTSAAEFLRNERRDSLSQWLDKNLDKPNNRPTKLRSK